MSSSKPGMSVHLGIIVGTTLVVLCIVLQAYFYVSVFAAYFYIYSMFHFCTI